MTFDPENYADVPRLASQAFGRLVFLLSTGLVLVVVIALLMLMSPSVTARDPDGVVVCAVGFAALTFALSLDRRFRLRCARVTAWATLSVSWMGSIQIAQNAPGQLAWVWAILILGGLYVLWLQPISQNEEARRRGIDMEQAVARALDLHRQVGEVSREA